MKSRQLSVAGRQLPVAGCRLPVRRALPAAHRPHSSSLRRGMTLLEVLAAIGVLSIGVLGLAALLPVGRYVILQATQADHAGDCGRAALRDISVRRMLAGASGTVVVDPLGMTGGLGKFGGSLTRSSLPSSSGFSPTDDLIVPLPQTGRPVNALNYNGSYSWFFTAAPTPGNTTRFTVSAVVCYNRDFSEATANVTQFFDQGLRGGSIQLSAPLAVSQNGWIALCGASPAKPIPTLCRWYRVAAVTTTSAGTQYMTLVGPDWDTSYTTTAVAIGQSVLGVYTTTIDLDSDPTWQK